MTRSMMGGWLWKVIGSGSVRTSISRRTQEVVRLGRGRNLATCMRPEGTEPSVQKGRNPGGGGARAARQEGQRAGQPKLLPASPFVPETGFCTVPWEGPGRAAYGKGSAERGGHVTVTDLLQGL